VRISLDGRGIGSSSTSIAIPVLRDGERLSVNFMARHMDIARCGAVKPSAGPGTAMRRDNPVHSLARRRRRRMLFRHRRHHPAELRAVEQRRDSRMQPCGAVCPRCRSRTSRPVMCSSRRISPSPRRSFAASIQADPIPAAFQDRGCVCRCTCLQLRSGRTADSPPCPRQRRTTHRPPPACARPHVARHRPGKPHRGWCAPGCFRHRQTDPFPEPAARHR
jgi:hypothetical protein